MAVLICWIFEHSFMRGVFGQLEGRKEASERARKTSKKKRIVLYCIVLYH